ncbi:unnamed protein product [Calypogeia fissa]
MSRRSAQSAASTTPLVDRRKGRRMMSNQVLTSFCFAVVVVVTSATMFVLVEGLPILGPDLNTCDPVIPATGTATDCCFVHTSRPIKDFQFNLDLPVRIRRPAHKLDEDEVRKYERAVALMRALPPEDPRSFAAQVKYHCGATAGAYNEFNSSQKMYMSAGWLLLPFHRWLMYFHERILASLIGDDTFTVPYWAWDVQNENNPAANSIPFYYTDRNSSLYNENRSKIHQPPARVDLAQPFGVHPTTNRDPEVQLQDNYYSMWRGMIGQVQTPENFYGAKISLGDSREGFEVSEGVFGLGLHTAPHVWTGDTNNPGFEDMGAAYSAARDPLLYAHHCQVDRLWLKWKSLGGQDFDDPDWLDTELFFTDENADMVRVNVRDSLNFDNFRITYEEVEADWLSYTPKSIRDINPKYAQSSSILRRFLRQVVTWVKYDYIAKALGSFLQKDKSEPNLFLGGTSRATATSRVPRPEVIVKSTEVSSVYDEVLVISGVVEKPFDATFLINMFLELPEADENTPQHCVEFLGAVVVAAEGLADGTDRIITRKFTRAVGIRETLRILEITHQPSVTVTFVPAWDPRYDNEISVRVTDLKVERRQAR